MEAVDIEPVFWDLGPRTPPLSQEVPQFLGVVDLAREATAHANDGDGCVSVHFCFGVGLLYDAPVLLKQSDQSRAEVTQRARRCVIQSGVGRVGVV
jgi:hypothetical protein